MTGDSANKFDDARARDFAVQSRIALAGYDACHELTACMLASPLEGSPRARVLVVGIGGTAREIVTSAPLHPEWEFVGVDPSRPMLDLASASLIAANVHDRVTLIEGYVTDLPRDQLFDAAIMIGVLHHVNGDLQKSNLLREIAALLKPKAPFVLAGNRTRYLDQPLFLEAWKQRWLANGVTEDEARAKLAIIVEKADPPASDAAVAGLLAGADYGVPTLFFSSLFWGAWITMRNPQRLPGEHKG